MRSDIQDDTSLRGRFLFVVFVAAPLVVWLADPPILRGDAADEVCDRLIEAAAEETGDPVLGEVEWRYLPSAHWECTVGTEQVDLGWWATEEP